MRYLYFLRARQYLRDRRERRALAPEVESILQEGICQCCGIWRCPECHWLIGRAHDHSVRCQTGRHHLAAEGYEDFG